MKKVLLMRKKFPEHYQDEVVDILTKMSLSKDVNHIFISGTASVRALLYFADYDANENFKRGTPAQFQASIKLLMHTPQCYIGDCKLGNIHKWNVVQEEDELKDYVFDVATSKLASLKRAHIISADEYNEARSLLKRNPSLQEFIKLKKLMRFGIVRWKPSDILKKAKYAYAMARH